MRPAFSVILLTTLIGAGQGLFLALFAAELYSRTRPLPAIPGDFFAMGSLIAVLLMGLGLLASFFHLGHPERAWRSAAMWRTSWLSREVIALPVTMLCVAAYGLSHFAFDGGGSLALGVLGTIATVALFVCTGMIYACIRFLQEWASPLTVVNYTLLGCASGFTLASAWAAAAAPSLTGLLAASAAVLTSVALVTRAASLARNARLRPKTTLESAIGVRDPRIRQKAQGFMGGSFNTREFFHGRTGAWLRGVKWLFLLLAFPVPVALLAAGAPGALVPVLTLAFLVQYAGLLAERWFFFAQANHPQNLYYQSIG